MIILPFEVSLNQREKLFSEGIRQDLILLLSRYESVSIISTHAADLFNSQTIYESGFIENTSTSFVVSGSFILTKDEFIIKIQMSETLTQSVVWMEKYKGKNESIYETQEQIAQRIANYLEIKSRKFVVSNAMLKSRGDLKAYECYLLGMEYVNKGTVKSDEKAREMFKKALKLDPNYSNAYTGLSLSYFNEWTCQAWNRFEIAEKGAVRYAEKALEINEYDYRALMVLGRCHMYKSEFEIAEILLRKALSINSNDTDILIYIGYYFSLMGYYREAKEIFHRAIELNPCYPEVYLGFGLMIYFESGDSKTALEYAKKLSSCTMIVDLPAYISACYYEAKNINQCLQYWNLCLKEFTEKITFGKPASNQFVIKWIIELTPIKNGQTKLITLFKHILGNEEIEIQSKEKQLTGKETNVFRKTNELWEVVFSNKKVIVPHLKGMEDIKLLLESPYLDISCYDLMGTNWQKDIQVPVVDNKAKQSIKKRIENLDEQIIMETELGNIENAENLQAEYDNLIEYLSKAYTKQGKIKNLDRRSDKVRSAVTWRIRHAIREIKKSHESLYNHLDQTIKTGKYCSYKPSVQSMFWIT